MLQAASSRDVAGEGASQADRQSGAVKCSGKKTDLHRLLFFDSSSQLPMTTFKAFVFSKLMTQNAPPSCYEQKGIVHLPSAVLTALHTQAVLNSISFDKQVPTVQSQQR